LAVAQAVHLVLITLVKMVEAVEAVLLLKAEELLLAIKEEPAAPDKSLKELVRRVVAVEHLPQALTVQQ
jgi:signal transduction histidine kinase